MKKIAICIICAAFLLITACSGSNAVSIEGNTVVVNSASLSVAFPEGWSITYGDELNKELLSQGGYKNTDDMQKSFKQDGICYYVRAASADDMTIAVVSSQDITPGDGGEWVTLEDYARSVHDSTIFEYYANGFKTGKDSSFSEVHIGEQSGYQSYFEVFTAEEEPVFQFGFSELMLQKDNLVYTVQVSYFTEESKEEALSVFDGITAE
ncbi:MAG: hypothetical protein ACI4KA_03015 [Oscillospiraceae bacterium]